VEVQSERLATSLGDPAFLLRAQFVGSRNTKTNGPTEYGDITPMWTQLRGYRTIPLLAVAIGGALACSASPNPNAGFQTRDSAGVEIVENGARVASRQLGAILVEQQGRRIETPDLATVRAALLLEDGRIVLTDNAASRLVFLGPDSGMVRSVGRRGDGPGEFRGFRGLWRCVNDTLAVRSGLAGVQLFDSDGRFVRMNAAPRLRGGAVGVTFDCSFIVMPDAQAAAQKGLMAGDSMVLAWYDLRRDTVVGAVTVPTPAREVIDYLGERMAVPIPFAPRPVFTLHGDQLLVGLGKSAEVRVFDSQARLTRILRWTAEPAPLSRSDRDHYEQLRLQLDERIGAGMTDRTPAIRKFSLPAMKPVYSAMRVDDDGRLWVRKYPDAWEGFERVHGPNLARQDPEWWIFAPSGRLLGSVTSPRNLRIMDMRGGMLLGLRSDSLNVPHLYVFPLMLERLILAADTL
jgi:hypothetical protein